MKLNDNEIVEIYDNLVSFYKKYLQRHGVDLPRLKKGSIYTKNALSLIYLARNYPDTKMVSKQELINFVREYYPDTNDVQQARHLSAQKGWWIAAGGRDDTFKNLPRGKYKLRTLKKPYPEFKFNRKLEDIGDDWDEIKRKYQHRCTTCGSEENKPNLHWKGTKTILQKTHIDPTKPLVAGNIIPQCRRCNKTDRGKWVYDKKGRIVKLAAAKVILSCSEKVQKEAYKLLQKKFAAKK